MKFSVKSETFYLPPRASVDCRPRRTGPRGAGSCRTRPGSCRACPGAATVQTFIRLGLDLPLDVLHLLERLVHLLDHLRHVVLHVPHTLRYHPELPLCHLRWTSSSFSFFSLSRVRWSMFSNWSSSSRPIACSSSTSNSKSRSLSYLAQKISISRSEKLRLRSASRISSWVTTPSSAASLTTAWMSM